MFVSANEFCLVIKHLFRVIYYRRYIQDQLVSSSVGEAKIVSSDFVHCQLHLIEQKFLILSDISITRCWWWVKCGVELRMHNYTKSLL